MRTLNIERVNVFIYKWGQGNLLKGKQGTGEYGQGLRINESLIFFVVRKYCGLFACRRGKGRSSGSKAKWLFDQKVTVGESNRAMVLWSWCLVCRGRDGHWHCYRKRKGLWEHGGTRLENTKSKHTSLLQIERVLSAVSYLSSGSLTFLRRRFDCQVKCCR